MEALRDRQTLLVLDNCEHVRSSVARLVEHILQASPRVKVLATSREPLGTYGETILTLSPLDIDEAVELLVWRTYMTVNEMINKLDDRFSILTTGSSTLSRHQTLEATVEFSYDLLDPEIQREFRTLSVFTGGFTLDTAESISGEGALEAVGSLIDKILVERR